MELASCDFIGRAEDVILAGPIGTGKTHLAIALGLEATRRRLRVHFARAADLVQSLVEARDERRLTMLQQRYQKVALLIVDELGSRYSVTKSSLPHCSIASATMPTYSQLAVIPFAASEESKSPPLAAQSKEVHADDSAAR